jgi:hypothetical protein
MKVGDKIKFINEKKRYTVRACDERYAVCTYPLNMIRRVRGGYKHEKTVMYCVIDFKKNIRGTENLIFGMGAESDEDCTDMLARFNEEDGSEISHRNFRELDIESVTPLI